MKYFFPSKEGAIGHRIAFLLELCLLMCMCLNDQSVNQDAFL